MSEEKTNNDNDYKFFESFISSSLNENCLSLFNSYTSFCKTFACQAMYDSTPNQTITFSYSFFHIKRPPGPYLKTDLKNFIIFYTLLCNKLNLNEQNHYSNSTEEKYITKPNYITPENTTDFHNKLNSNMYDHLPPEQRLQKFTEIINSHYTNYKLPISTELLAYHHRYQIKIRYNPNCHMSSNQNNNFKNKFFDLTKYVTLFLNDQKEIYSYLQNQNAKINFLLGFLDY